MATRSLSCVTSSFVAFGLGAVFVADPARGAVVNFNAPNFDRWNYPFNGSPGSRSAAPTFSAVGSPAFDNRDGQFLVGFNTAASLPTLPSGQSYRINSVTVTATHSTGVFNYDPIYDSFRTFLDPADPQFVADADAGRPILLTGATLRNGYTAFAFGSTAAGGPTYEEGESFGPGGAPAPRVRNAFAASFNAAGALVDVSNNVTDRFEVLPWAVGQSTSGLTAGAAVPQGSPGSSTGETFSFALDLANADILNYVEDGIDAGGLFFSVTSLHSSGMQGGSNPNFYTKENFDPFARDATLAVDFTVVPEPASLGVLAVGGLALLARRRRTKVPA